MSGLKISFCSRSVSDSVEIVNCGVSFLTGSSGDMEISILAQDKQTAAMFMNFELPVLINKLNQHGRVIALLQMIYLQHN